MNLKLNLDNKKLKKIKYFTLILALILLTNFIMSYSYIKASEDKEIRIGLRELYENLASININNTSLTLLSSDNGKYNEEYDFKSQKGFKIIPANETYLISSIFFNSYEECVKKINEINSEFDLYPAWVSKNNWKIYILNSSDKGNQIINNIEFKEINDNGLRTLLEYEGKTVVLDNEIDHSLFITKDLEDGVSVINLGERKYRGKIEIGRYNKKGLTAINQISIEEYLYGVIPSEMPALWPQEALKAQTVAARSYALYNIEYSKYPNEAYELCDTTISQVYKGFSFEHPLANKAIDDTKGVCVYSENKIIPAYFFSTSGGHTEDSENVWSGTVSYLKGVPDIYETEPSAYPWTKTFTNDDIKNILKKYNINIGDIKDIRINTYSKSGRVMSLNIIGTSGEYEMVKETIRTWLEIRSRKFTLVKSDYKAKEVYGVISKNEIIKYASSKDINVINGDGTISKLNNSNEQIIVMSDKNIDIIPTINGKTDTYIIMGQGYGHGVGMSQSGAKGMAKAGYTYKEILEYYFTGVVVK